MDPRVLENLAMLEEQNKAKKAIEQADKQRMEREEREKGFNVFISGANEDRVNLQNRKNKAKDASKIAQVVRRKWEAPNSASSRGKPNDDQYMNPFETHSESFATNKREGSQAGADSK